jgi:hypothetical protein
MQDVPNFVHGRTWSGPSTSGISALLVDARAKPGHERLKPSASHFSGREFQGGLDVIARQLRPGIDDLFGCITISDAADDHAHRHARAFDARLAVMYRRIDDDFIASVHRLRLG